MAAPRDHGLTGRIALERRVLAYALGSAILHLGAMTVLDSIEPEPEPERGLICRVARSPEPGEELRDELELSERDEQILLSLSLTAHEQHSDGGIPALPFMAVWHEEARSMLAQHWCATIAAYYYNGDDRYSWQLEDDLIYAVDGAYPREFLKYGFCNLYGWEYTQYLNVPARHEHELWRRFRPDRPVAGSGRTGP